MSYKIKNHKHMNTELTALHEALKDSKAAEYFVKHPISGPGRLTLVTKDNNLTIHIKVDKNNPGRFTYTASTHRIEEQENVTTEEIIEVVYGLLKP